MSEEDMKHSSKYVYGTELRDDALLRDPFNFPRYAHLGRKALMHYASEKYNPHTIQVFQEHLVRLVISDLVEHKVRNKLKSYDWEFVEHTLMRIIDTYYKIGLPYDNDLIERKKATYYNTPLDTLTTKISN